jgi:transcriptional regulator with XRE-family HTH domain
MTAAEFREALDRLGWSQSEAGRRLGVVLQTGPRAGQPNRPRIGAWYHGRRPVPTSVAAHLRTHLTMWERSDD